MRRRRNEGCRGKKKAGVRKKEEEHIWGSCGKRREAGKELLIEKGNGREELMGRKKNGTKKKEGRGKGRMVV